MNSNRIEVHGYRVDELAGLVRMCGESIYKELVSIGRSHPEALVQHSQSVTDTSTPWPTYFARRPCRSGAMPKRWAAAKSRP